MSLIADALKRAQSSRLARRYRTSEPSGVLPVAGEGQRLRSGAIFGSILDRIQPSAALWIGLGSGILLFAVLSIYFFRGVGTRGKSVAARNRPAQLILTEPPALPVSEAPSEVVRSLGEEILPTEEEERGALPLQGQQDQEVGAAAARGVEPGPEGSPATEAGASESASSKVSIMPDLSEEVRYRFNLGLFYQEEGNFRLARREYEKVVQMWPLNAEAHNNLAVVYKELGLYDQAITHLRKALALNPSYTRAYHNLGVIYQLKGNLPQAEKNYKRALILDRTLLGSYNNLGLVYRAKKQIHEARQILERALTIDPNYAQTHYNLALVLEDSGENERARFHFQRFVDLAGEKNRRLVERVQAHLRELPSRDG